MISLYHKGKLAELERFVSDSAVPNMTTSAEVISITRAKPGAEE
jgi:hypothetical protein